ncbi:MAG TPA: hypothetical protein VNZ61_01895 [Roseomonas sp.]|nr:hypothetical protein [Roseomonas sp.]
MPAARAADSWDEVWGAYEARQSATQPPAPKPAATEAAPPPARPASRRRQGLVVLALLVLTASSLSAPARPLLGMARLALAPDVPALLAGLELRPEAVALPQALSRGSAPEAGEGPAVEHFLGVISGALAEGWRDPEALRRMLLARQGLPVVPGATLRPLEAVRSVRPLGWAAVRLEIGPPDGPAGLQLDLAWQGGAWHLHRLEVLEPLPASG